MAGLQHTSHLHYKHMAMHLLGIPKINAPNPSQVNFNSMLYVEIGILTAPSLIIPVFLGTHITNNGKRPERSMVNVNSPLTIKGLTGSYKSFSLVMYLGGSDGAITLAKYSWFPWLPRITSATVLMVSVRMSTGTPLAIRMLHRVSSNPQAFIVFCDDCVTWAGFPGVTNVRTTCNTEQNGMVLLILWNKQTASYYNHDYLTLLGWWNKGCYDTTSV